jgi:hypothetical protein
MGSQRHFFAPSSRLVPMSECADCGGRVEGFATYCDDCRGATPASDRETTTVGDDDPTTGTGREAPATDARGTHAERSTDATDSAGTHVGAFLAVAAAGAYGLFETLRFVLAVGPSDLFGNLYGEFLTVPLVAAYGVMAKRLLDGTADHARYRRILVATAGLTLAFQVLRETGGGFSIAWLPRGADPGSLALYVLAYSPLYQYLQGIDLGGAFLVVGTGATGLAAHHLRPTGR